MKIKLMLIAQSNGGVSEYLKNFIRYVDKEKYDISLVVSYQYKIEMELFTNLGCNIHFVDMTREIQVIKDILCVREIKKIVKNINPDIIYAHSSKAGVLTRLAINSRKIPIVYNSHGWAFNMRTSKIKKTLYVIIEKVCAINTSKIVCISESEKESALKFNICSKNKLKTIYNGIDLNKTTKKDKENILNEIGFDKNSFIIGQVGRLDEQKNPLMFVDIAKELINKNVNACFLLVGDGKLRINVEERIKEYGLEEKFYITGWTSRVIDYISSMDMGLLTSRWEGFGLVLVEYMSLALPVIASNVDGIPNVIQNEYNGILCDCNEKMQFVNSIIRVMNDEKLKNKISRNGSIVAKKNFSIERVVNEHDKLFNEIIR